MAGIDLKKIAVSDTAVIFPTKKAAKRFSEKRICRIKKLKAKI